MSAAIRTTLQGATGCVPKMAGRAVEVGSASNATGARRRAVAARRRGASPLLSGCMPGLRPDTLKARSLEKHPERELNGTIGSHPLKGGFRGWRCARNAD